MTDNRARPAWSEQFSSDAISELSVHGPMSEITREWAWGGSAGQGVRVAVIDSGIDHDHPDLDGCVAGGVAIEFDEESDNYLRVVEEPKPVDLTGHGTACAGIIHALAPEAELFSVRVLGVGGRGRALQFAGGLEWAVDNGIRVSNLSLSTSLDEYYAIFHRVADRAYFNNVMLVSAVNNIHAPSYPSLYSSVISVAAHEGKDPFSYYYNPDPPVEFGAPGFDVKVAWTNHSHMLATGNSYAAPHIAGLVALICANHPDLTPFQIKAILYACASNASRQDRR